MLQIISQGLGLRLMLWIFKKWKWEGDIDWIDLAQNTNRWLALVYAIISLWVP
jgi:hypothetical protein